MADASIVNNSTSNTSTTKLVAGVKHVQGNAEQQTTNNQDVQNVVDSDILINFLRNEEKRKLKEKKDDAIREAILIQGIKEKKEIMTTDATQPDAPFQGQGGDVVATVEAAMALCIQS